MKGRFARPAVFLHSRKASNHASPTLCAASAFLELPSEAGHIYSHILRTLYFVSRQKVNGEERYCLLFSMRWRAR